jgi:hypothetical protein
VEIVDPREAELPAVGHLAMVDPESGARIEVDTSSRRLRRLRIEHVSLSTDEDWLVALGRHLR